MPEPSAMDLLRERDVDIDEYADEVLNKTKISKAKSMILYGSPYEPIPIPLKRLETREVFETRFVNWLYRERNHTITSLRRNANWERSCRFAFARAEARAYLLNGDDDDIKEELDVKLEDRDDVDIVVVGAKREREKEADEDVSCRKMKCEVENDEVHGEATNEQSHSLATSDERDDSVIVTITTEPPDDEISVEVSSADHGSQMKKKDDDDLVEGICEELRSPSPDDVGSVNLV